MQPFAGAAVYLATLSRATAAAAIAALVCGALEVVFVRVQYGAGGPELFAAIAGIYALFVFPWALASAAVWAAWRLTWGERSLARAYERLRRDRALDQNASAAVVAAVVAAVAFAAFVQRAAIPLVAEVARHNVGATILGTISAAAVPVFAILAMPLYRVAAWVTRRLTRRAARSATPSSPVRLPYTVVIAVLAVLGPGLWLVLRLRHALEWHAVDVEGWLMVAAGPAVMALSAWGLHRVGSRKRVESLVSACALVLAIMAAASIMTATMARIVAEHTVGVRVLVHSGRLLVDGDGDGFSPWLHGPDCDDGNANVHPLALEIAGNGVDDDCRAGDQADPGRDLSEGDGDIAHPPTRPGTRPLTRPLTPLANHSRNRASRPNLLFILVDTLRADRLGVGGYRRDGVSITPHLDRLAARSSYFSRVYAQSSNTPRSLPSMWTSRYPSQLAMHADFHNMPLLLDDNVLLFEILSQAGYHTMGFASHSYFAERRNAHQGFTTFDNRGARDLGAAHLDIAAPRIVPRAIAALETMAQASTNASADPGAHPPFAMFVHLFEPHAAYIAHGGQRPPATANPSSRTDTAAADTADRTLDPKDWPAAYDAEISFVDAWVGRLLTALVDTDLASRTVVVLVSDHGETFGRRTVAGKRIYFHGRTLYDEVLRVPLVIHVPKHMPQHASESASPSVPPHPNPHLAPTHDSDQHVGEGRHPVGAYTGHFDDPVMLIDVAPTILDLLEVAIPETFQGRSLLPRLRGHTWSPRPAYAEIMPTPAWPHHARTVITADGRFKLIHWLSLGRFELYDLANDPHETTDVAAEKPARTSEMHTIMDRILASMNR